VTPVLPHLVVQELSVDLQGTERYVHVLLVMKVIHTQAVQLILVVRLLVELMLSVRGQEVEVVITGLVITLSLLRPGDTVLEQYVNVLRAIVEILL